MAGGGAVRAERRHESERARMGWRREWRVCWRCPRAEGEVVASASHACRPRGAVGLTRSGAHVAVSERGGGRWTRRGEAGLASLAGPVG